MWAGESVDALRVSGEFCPMTDCIGSFREFFATHIYLYERLFGSSA